MRISYANALPPLHLRLFLGRTRRDRGWTRGRGALSPRPGAENDHRTGFPLKLSNPRPGTNALAPGISSWPPGYPHSIRWSLIHSVARHDGFKLPTALK